MGRFEEVLDQRSLLIFGLMSGGDENARNTQRYPA